MQIHFTADERPILLARLGLSDTATDADIGAAVDSRLAASAAPAATRQAVRQGDDLVGTVNTAERDSAIAAAVRDGKFAAERAQHWGDKWDRDPIGTQRTIAQLAPVPPDLLEPVAAHAGAASYGLVGDSAYPREWAPDLHGGQPRQRVTMAD